MPLAWSKWASQHWLKSSVSTGPSTDGNNPNMISFKACFINSRLPEEGITRHTLGIPHSTGTIQNAGKLRKRPSSQREAGSAPSHSRLPVCVWGQAQQGAPSHPQSPSNPTILSPQMTEQSTCSMCCLGEGKELHPQVSFGPLKGLGQHSQHRCQ